MAEELIRFLYTNANGETTARTLTNFQESGHYLKGYCLDYGAVRTFRKDRVSRYFDGAELRLFNAFPPPPPKPQKDTHIDHRPQVLFTGFPAVQRAALEAKANNNGLKVVASVTQRLVFLCCGPNAGPAKVEKSREQGVYIVDEPQFHLLLETGELADESLPYF